MMFLCAKNLASEFTPPPLSDAMSYVVPAETVITNYAHMLRLRDAHSTSYLCEMAYFCNDINTSRVFSCVSGEFG